MAETKEVSILTDKDKRKLNLAVLEETTSVMNPTEYAQMKKMAADFWNSNAISESFQNVDQVIMALNAGREMGMSFTESINGLYFVKGKLNIYGKATPAALRRAGWKIRFLDESQLSVTAEVTNVKTGEQITDTYTYKEAEDSGFTKDSQGRLKIGWRPGANRKRKLRYGVLSQIIHTYIPEVIGGAVGIGEYSEDYVELGAKTLKGVSTDQVLIDETVEKIEATETEDELKTFYLSLPPSIKLVNEVIEAKDKRKAELSESN